MKISKNTLLLASLFCIASPLAQAASATFSETQTDKLKCKRVDGVSQCAVETTGKFSVSANLQSAQIAASEFNIFDITPNTSVGILIGDFQFNALISDTVKFSMSSAVWKLFHEVCNSQGKCKDVADTTIAGKIGLSKIAVKVSGNSKRGDVTFGGSIFATLCEGQSDGYNFSNVPVELNLADPGDENKQAFDKTFTTTASGTCSIKTVSKSKNNQNFDLTTIKVKGSIGDLQYAP